MLIAKNLFTFTWCFMVALGAFLLVPPTAIAEKGQDGMIVVAFPDPFIARPHGFIAGEVIPFRLLLSNFTKDDTGNTGVAVRAALIDENQKEIVAASGNYPIVVTIEPSLLITVGKLAIPRDTEPRKHKVQLEASDMNSGATTTTAVEIEIASASTLGIRDIQIKSTLGGNAPLFLQGDTLHLTGTLNGLTATENGEVDFTFAFVFQDRKGGGGLVGEKYAARGRGFVTNTGEINAPLEISIALSQPGVFVFAFKLIDNVANQEVDYFASIVVFSYSDLGLLVNSMSASGVNPHGIFPALKSEIPDTIVPLQTILPVLGSQNIDEPSERGGAPSLNIGAENVGGFGGGATGGAGRDCPCDN